MSRTNALSDISTLSSYSPSRWTLRNDPRSDAQFIGLMIISATHRTGSTLLQRICNARPGTLIWGEHGGMLSHFADIYLSAAAFATAGAQERDDYFSQGENPNLWIANMCPELPCVQQAVIDSVRGLLETLYGQYRGRHDLVGFKEVQYDTYEIELLRRCYPDAPILLLTRNPLNTWKSTPKDWYLSVEEWATKWNRATINLREFAASDPKCHLIRYEDLVRRDEATMAIVAEAARVTPDQIKSVLSHKVGSINAGIYEREEQAILERCRNGMEILGYL